MAFKSSYLGNLPKGIPGHIYKEASDYGRYGMGLDERRTVHQKIYGWLRGILPESELRTEEQGARVQLLLNEMPGFLDTLRKLIPHNEMRDDVIITPGDLENIQKNLDALVERWTEIISITGIFDGMRPASAKVTDADE